MGKPDFQDLPCCKILSLTQKANVKYYFFMYLNFSKEVVATCRAVEKLVEGNANGRKYNCFPNH